MARVVLVHGINNTFGGPTVMEADWVPALLSGVDLAGGKGRIAPADVAAVFYGDFFRRPGVFLSDDDGLGDGGWDADAVPDGVESDVLVEWWRAAAEVDPSVVPVDAVTLGVADRVQAALAALAGSKLLAGAGERLLIGLLRQVRAYFTDDAVRGRVQERFAAVIGADTEVVVAHSLGSVVAYEALCAHPEWPVRALVTVGSPLGIRNVVFDRLRPAPQRHTGGWRGVWPASVWWWTNIADRRDFVALDKRLHRWFGDAVVDVQINNGWRFHDVGRYLTAQETGAAVSAGLQGTGGVPA